MQKKTKKIIAIVLIVVAALSAIGGIATGIYFGVKTVTCEGYVKDKASEAPIANVAVTNGKNVVKTDENGYYKVDGWFKARFITVTIPSGYWTEKYYIAIESKTESYDFALDKLARDDSEHTFVHISDTEVGEKGVGTWINDVKKVVDEQSPAFIMHTGDICYTDGLQSHIVGMNSENMGVPVRYTMGNHDYVDGAYGEDLFESIYGPACYSFDVGDIHYIVTPFGQWADRPAKYTNADIGRWVENDLNAVSPNKKVIMFNHTYANSENDFEVKYGAKTIDYKEHNLLAWIFGHWHYNYVNEVNGILNISTGKPDTGGVDSTANAVRTVTIKDKAINNTQLYYGYTDAVGDGEHIWQKKLNGRAQFSDPIIVGDTAYVATISDNYPSTCGITAVNMSDGTILWEYSTKNSVRNSIAYKDGKLIAQDCEGVVYCIDTTTGNEVWRRDTLIGDPRNSGKNVLIDGDKIYCGNAEKITCLNITNGEFVWQHERTGNSSSPTRYVISDDILLVGSHWDRLIAINKNTGKKLWESSETGIFITSTPIVRNKKVILAYGSNLYEMNIENGKTIRNKEFSEYNFDTASTPLVIGNIGYYATVNKGVVAINLDTFETVWNFETKKNLIYTSPYSGGGSKTVDGSIIERDGKLYFGALDGYIYCVDKTSGLCIAKYNLGSPIMNSVALFGDKMLISDFSGNITMINLSSIRHPHVVDEAE